MMTGKHITMTAAYSAAHFAIDFCCAFLMLGVVRAADNWQLCALLYNFCAFAMQMPIGLLLDRLNRNSAAALTGCVLVAFSFCFASVPVLAAMVAGIGNALFHVGGGIDVLNISRGKAGALGVFISPGALGIYLGGIVEKGAEFSAALPPAVLGFCTVAIFTVLLVKKRGAYVTENVPVSLEGAGSPRTLVSLLFLFLVVVLRSYAGMNMDFSWRSVPSWGLIALLAVVAGKAAGGFAANALGMGRAAAFSLLPAAVLFLINSPFTGAAAILLFNMTMPMTLCAVARIMPGAKGFSFGLLTFALFIGFLPSVAGWKTDIDTGLLLAAVSVVSLVLLIPGIRRGKQWSF